MTSTHTARIKPKADNSPILDSRGPKYKRTYPWWWRSPKSTTIHNAMSVYAMELAMNRYELGRRFLIQTQSKPASMCISIESMLKRKPHFENDLLVSLGEFGADMSIETSLVPDWGFLMKSIDELPKRLPSKKTPWKRIPVFAWNLECPWKVVSGHLKTEFDRQREIEGITTIRKGGKRQKPSWSRLEVWDMATAGKDIPSRFANGITHANKVQSVKAEAEQYCEIAASISDCFQMEVCHSILGVNIASCPDGFNRLVYAIWRDYFKMVFFAMLQRCCNFTNS